MNSDAVTRAQDHDQSETRPTFPRDFSPDSVDVQALIDRWTESQTSLFQQDLGRHCPILEQQLLRIRRRARDPRSIRSVTLVRDLGWGAITALTQSLP